MTGIGARSSYYHIANDQLKAALPGLQKMKRRTFYSMVTSNRIIAKKTLKSIGRRHADPDLHASAVF